MGSFESSLNDENEQQDLFEKYVVMEKALEHNVFGRISILQNQITNEKIALKEQTCMQDSQSNSNFQLQLKSLKNRVHLQHPNLIKCYGVYNQREKLFCGTVEKFYLQFEYCCGNLEQEIKKKQYDNSYYTEDEVWMIVEGLIAGLAFMQQNQMQHNDIRPETIFISNTGVYKVVEQGLFQSNNSFAQVIIGGQIHNIYISPTLMLGLKNSDWQPIHNSYKSDVYSLGMCILHVMLLKSCDELYDYQNYKLNTAKIKQFIDDCKKNYTIDLINIILKMLAFDENIRPDFINLLEIINNQLGFKIAKGSILYKSENSDQSLISNSYKNSIIEQETKCEKQQLSQYIYDQQTNQSPFDQSQLTNNQNIYNNTVSTINFEKNILNTQQSNKSGDHNTNIQKIDQEYYPNGSCYIGEKQNGLRNGFGKFCFADGGYYIGQWQNNKMHGQGTLFYSSEKIAYEGEWFEDKFNGKATLYNDNPTQFTTVFNYRDFDELDNKWIKYIGEFRDDCKQGKGILFLSNGERYEGTFQNDYIDGQGQFFLNNNNVIKGIWRCNKFQGFN